ncbi:hypothetical protein K227x_46410 [Rubripirellula lacrimiformis]|uniref:SGNH hydrolase-type esterase domain-containing protein n=1 Tax=Rubripirellula lacrimiformis TaxID=1930273 RepID=A0A517NGH5_9BACT|nr:hypothetical protein [Rubripirellula lacrimiformis]QDT06232.1 hypothetical protein K227x_46410 [Rubripirellula lacrimiformis]
MRGLARLVPASSMTASFVTASFVTATLVPITMLMLMVMMAGNPDALAADGQPDSATPLLKSPLLKSGDRIAVLGGTFVERMQSGGSLEAELQCRRPDWKLSVRNLGWSGDDVHGIARKRFDGPEDGYKRILADVAVANPNVVIVAYGMSEASDGDEAVDRFEAGLRRLVGDLQTAKYRVILMPPMAMPGVRTPGYTSAIDRCRSIVTAVSQQLHVPELEIQWRAADDQVTENGLLPSAAGYASLAVAAADPLVGGSPCDSDGTGDSGDSKLQELIAAKNQLFFHRYRPQNETYLTLFRKHEQGNNAVEIPQFDPLIEAADREIWAAASR